MPAPLLLLTCTALGQAPTPPRPHLLKFLRPSAAAERADTDAPSNLAAAHAEAGHFDRAIELAEAARQLPIPYPVSKQVDRASGAISFRYDFPSPNQARDRQIRTQALAGYRDHKPWRDDR